jgi:hypothetical protein
MAEARSMEGTEYGGTEIGMVHETKMGAAPGKNKRTHAINQSHEITVRQK